MKERGVSWKDLGLKQPDNIGKTVDTKSISCTGCHSDVEKGALLKTTEKRSVLKDPKGITSLKLVDIILNGPDCSTAQCHAHPADQVILGFVEAELSLAILDEALLKQGLALTAYVVMFVLTVSLFLGLILYKIVSKPVPIKTGHRPSDSEAIGQWC